MADFFVTKIEPGRGMYRRWVVVNKNTGTTYVVSVGMEQPRHQAKVHNATLNRTLLNGSPSWWKVMDAVTEKDTKW